MSESLWPHGQCLPVSLSTGFSRQEYWNGLLCPPPGELLDPGIELMSLMSPGLSGQFFTKHLVQYNKIKFEESKYEHVSGHHIMTLHPSIWHFCLLSLFLNFLYSRCWLIQRSCSLPFPPSCSEGIPTGSDGKDCNAGDLDSIPGSGDPLEKEMANCSRFLFWRNPWTEELGELQAMGLQRVKNDWVTNPFTFTPMPLIPKTFCRPPCGLTLRGKPSSHRFEEMYLQNPCSSAESSGIMLGGGGP